MTEYILGRCTSSGIKGGIGIPGLDSWLVGFSTDTKVIGLHSVPPDDRPPANTMLHWAFDIMVGVGSALMLLGLWLGATWLFRRDMPRSPWFLRATAVSGIAAVVALECGWIVTEVGRQPYIVYGFMRTEDAVTDASGVWISLGGGPASLRRRRDRDRVGAASDGASLADGRARRGRGALRATPGPAGPVGGAGLSTADAVAAVLWTGVTLYAVFGGADFGAGFWTLVARGDERGNRARALIAWAIGPVWESNHVWLIFVLVVLWTGFPEAFASIMSTLFIPLSLAAFGIVLRGAGFAFQGVAARERGRRLATRAFALSSVMTPFFMGTVAGAVASGRVPIGNAKGDPVTSWVNPVSILIGVLFIAAGAYLAAVFLASDARRFGDPDLESYFETRALGAAVAAGIVAVAGIFVLHEDARYIYDGLVSEGLPLVIASGVCGAAALLLLWRGARRGVRVLAGGAVVAVIWAWGAAQYPYLLPEKLTVADGAASSETLTALLVLFGVAVVLVVPSLALLYTLDQRTVLEEEAEP